jgi:hypothetical protein
MRTDGQTGMTKLIVVFRNFAKAPKKAVNRFTGQKLWSQIYEQQAMKEQ